MDLKGNRYKKLWLKWVSCKKNIINVWKLNQPLSRKNIGAFLTMLIQIKIRMRKREQWKL